MRFSYRRIPCPGRASEVNKKRTGISPDATRRTLVAVDLMLVVEWILIRLRSIHGSYDAVARQVHYADFVRGLSG